ncbi:MAG: hypothetical protein A2W98_01390 [Bacteroidetes bacterium GWF2_33_38]|nr:MAG: hypothetical protein A2W98_01390 [Bacteroidetes bacterium GWF2_33_38]OFY72444.1 MAG: hypothetical protein A2265_03330 [Bacteroidetes bacterium RIFOXYA12_FULL_33_9]OFY91365.1 MAG: hypothetical protein A2236_13885 [Bacteroidetes bacterium RIFOXYA2_FULL_33_7]
MKLRYKIWIEIDGKGAFGDGKWELLKAIDETGSLKEAMEKLNLTYRKTWNNLQKMEELLGVPLIQTNRGGTDGGSSCLTPEGKKIITIFHKFHEKYDAEINKEFEKILSELKA